MGDLHQLPDLTRRAAALEYAKRAWHVFPVHTMREGRCSCGRECGRPGKHPMTPNGYKDATISIEQVDGWWTTNPDANIGIACGASRLLVVDVDPRNQGDETLAELERGHGPLPRTLTACTGGGGQHYYYDVTALEALLPGRVLGAGVELKAGGGYVVAPPSTHVSGRLYGWDLGQPDTLEFPPPWLIDADKRKARNFAAPGEVLDGIIGTAFSAAGMLGKPLGPDRCAVVCPWAGDHTEPASPLDTSTIVFGPTGKGKWGWFHCSHAHCKERLAGLRGVDLLHEVMRALPPEAAAYAAERVSGAKRELQRVVNEAWESSLVWDAKGNSVLGTPGNLKLCFDNMPDWKASIAYDESKDRLFWARKSPEVIGLSAPEVGENITEHDWIYVSQWFATKRKIMADKHSVSDVMVAAGRGNARNSLGDYLSSIQWDGVKRLDAWLTTYCGAEVTEYTRRVGRAWLISAMARALDPGCQTDHVLVLEGKQGAGKTSVFRVLGGDWYLGNLPRIDDKDSRHVLGGSWMVEIQELAALKGSAMEKVKAYLTERVDMYRPPYHRDFVRKPRRCIFGASTNENELPPDATGLRRFWAVRVGLVAVELLTQDRDQLLAEARDAFLDGERWWFTPGELALQAAVTDEQSSRQVDDPWQEKIESVCLQQSTLGDWVTTSSILTALGVPLEKQATVESRRVAVILRGLGYIRVRRSVDGGAKRWIFVKHSGS